MSASSSTTFSDCELAPGLWMFGGTAPNARWFSRFVALSIQSDVLGKPLECIKLAG